MQFSHKMKIETIIIRLDHFTKSSIVFHSILFDSAKFSENIHAKLDLSWKWFENKNFFWRWTDNLNKKIIVKIARNDRTENFWKNFIKKTKTSFDWFCISINTSKIWTLLCIMQMSRFKKIASLSIMHMIINKN